MTRRFVLIDRDGTLNVERHYLSDPAQLELVPGAGEALRRLKAAGLGIIVVTNQSGLARGMFTQADLDRVHVRLGELLAADGAAIDGVHVCPHGPADACACRKPLPGMVLAAAAEHGFDPAQAFVIGDKAADIEMGRATGATTFLVRTGYGAETERAGTAAPDFVVDDLAQAAAAILALLHAEAAHA